MQTMDLILVKKKRIALAKRDSALPPQSPGPSSPLAIWNILKTVASSGRDGIEGKNSIIV